MGEIFPSHLSTCIGKGFLLFTFLVLLSLLVTRVGRDDVSFKTLCERNPNT